MKDSNPGVFINILTDFGFKYFFGSGADPEFLISLLNAVFYGEPHIDKIIKIDKEQPGENVLDRTIIYDVHCLTDKGETIIVEMQNRFQEYYRDRAIYYVSKDIISQGEKGSEWKFGLKPVYGVFLMNFDWREFKHDLIRDEVCLMSKTTGDVFSDKLRMFFLKIPLMKKKPEECESDFDIWMYLFKNIDKMNTMPREFMNKDVFRKFEQKARLGVLSDDELKSYERSLKRYRDNLAVEGGVEYRIRTSRAEGRAEGEAKGRAEEKINLAKTLIEKGMDKAFISEVTGLSVKDIEKL